ncbi:hypothetical protein [Pseudolysinimonas sp.]|jgi:hypothetical protein|uniref:hypothetical protein n=1 Tax=Pseudolysinimonas sp. TaxID=2680009 RepID=UPI0037838AA0
MSFLAGRPAAALLAAAVLLALTGCVDAGSAPQLPTDEVTPTPGLPTAPVTPTTTPTAGADPLGIPCDELVDPDAVYAFDPNFALIGGYNPPAGSAAEEALAAGGVACQWVRESGGITMEVSVARLSDEEIVDRKNAAFASSQMVPTYGDEAYFEVDGGVGTAIVFQGDYWVVVTSPAFAEPGEPTEIIESVLAAL